MKFKRQGLGEVLNCAEEQYLAYLKTSIMVCHIEDEKHSHYHIH